MVTTGAGPESSGVKSLGDADESDEAYSGIIMEKEAGVLLCSQTCMLKIHQSDICVNVQVLRPWLDKRSSAQMPILYKVFGCRCTNSILPVLYSAMTLVSVIILYILKYPFFNSPHNILPLLISKYPFRKIKEEKIK